MPMFSVTITDFWRGNGTDLHPDPFYKAYSSTSSDKACHGGSGSAGYYGAETSDCDSPLSLVNATFHWIDKNLADQIDFIVWTGDSARHDNDESIPRNESQVISQNEFIVSKFREVFGKHNGDEDDDDPTNDFKVPIIPTFGNNDFLPHNIFLEGPNHWTKQFVSIWRSFIPEEQRHAFEQGGWFYAEVIPDHLAVFSLNTMYFFAKNAGVDGCAASSEPGYEAFEWLRVRLQLLRERGMKAILSGHVPPARTESKQQWDETCWQKYALWLRQYRDVVIGGLWGHMNVEHFMLQDFEEISWDVLGVDTDETELDRDLKRARRLELRKREDDDFNIASTEDYLKDLRHEWADLPKPPPSMRHEELARDVISSVSDDSRPEWEIDLFARRHNRISEKKKKGDEKKRQQFLKKIGGKWHERYSVSLVSPSVVPNYFPTLRVFEYNTTGINLWNAFDKNGKTSLMRAEEKLQRKNPARRKDGLESEEDGHDKTTAWETNANKKGKKDKKPKFTIPDPPTKSVPPGPAYSPQSLTLVGYTQYYANLTEINNDFHNDLATSSISGSLQDDGEGWEGKDLSGGWGDWLGSIWKWKEGKHHDKKPKKPSPQPKPFEYQVEYDTQNDKVYKLKDLTVGNWVHLARRVGKKGKPEAADLVDDDFVAEGESITNQESEEVDTNLEDGVFGGTECDGVETQKKHKHRKGKKHKHKKNKVWYTFIKRAFVSTMDASEIDDTYG